MVRVVGKITSANELLAESRDMETANYFDHSSAQRKLHRQESSLECSEFARVV